MAGFDTTLNLNPYAPPFFPTTLTTNYFYLNHQNHQLLEHNYNYFYYDQHLYPNPNPNPNPNPFLITLFSSPPPPPTVVAPPPTTVAVAVDGAGQAEIVVPPPAPVPAHHENLRSLRYGQHVISGRSGGSRRRSGGGGGGGGRSGLGRVWRAEREREGHALIRVEPNSDYTTVMIRNIPNQYTEMLKQFLDHHCNEMNKKNMCSSSTRNREKEANTVSAYDFLYLPIDFETKVNKGYAFVNFTEPRAVWRFYNCYENQKWAYFRSSKRCDITYARIQGKKELEKHFEGMVFGCEEEEFLPIMYTPPRDGSGKLVRERTIGGLICASQAQGCS